MPSTVTVPREALLSQAALLSWGAGRRADLPWRGTRDPWAVLVSEVMLQQTQVERVRSRWVSFLERFPTVAACAAAPLGDVLEEWSGLGYPRRARDLHRTASIVVSEHHGRFPDRLDDLLALPGIGPYTARAVLAFAYERDVGIVDTNVGRILARRAGRRLGAGEAQDTADRWVPGGHGWAWNQAMLDLGALVCRPKAPDCRACPVSTACEWHRGGNADPDPAVGSARVSTRQAPFPGSARQARGAILRALGAGSLSVDDVASVVGWAERPGSDVADLVGSLVDDGLVVVGPGRRLSLPGRGYPYVDAT